MNSSPTHWILVGLLILFAHDLLGSDPGKDFLITLNGTKLTGAIKTVSYQKKNTQISFQNDLGTSYTVDASTILGFAVEEAGEIFMYESKHLNGVWQFLKVEKKGMAVSWYTQSERQLQYIGSDKPPIVAQELYKHIWLQFKGEQPFRLHRFSFRRVLRKKMKSFPDLAKRIGKRGFRYKNLPMIVDSYNKFHENN